MRIEIPAKDVRPDDQIWFSGDRRPGRVVSVTEQDGAEKLIVLHGESKIWYLNYERGVVNKYVEDEPVVDEDAPVFEDPDGNPT
jgi:hypothetical protein